MNKLIYMIFFKNYNRLLKLFPEDLDYLYLLQYHDIKQVTNNFI